jgi:protease I
MLGGKATPDKTLALVKAQDFDAVVFVGGAGAQAYFNDPAAHKLAKDAAAQGKVLGAICLGPAILARAGVLSGKKATVWSGARGDLEKGGADYTGNPVETSGKTVTANGPDAAAVFARAILAALK